MATITITTEERNQLWSAADFTFPGDLEEIVGCGGSRADLAVIERSHRKAEVWLQALSVLGFERTRESDADLVIALDGPWFGQLVDGAYEMALEVVNDYSMTLAKAIREGVDPALFLPPAEGDEQGGWIEAAFAIRAIWERLEAAQPGVSKASV